MLQINDLSYRIEGRSLFESATVTIPQGHKVGVVGRNGIGKSTLLRLIAGELAPDAGTIGLPRNARIGMVAQEAPGGDRTLIDTVLTADLERAELLAEAETACDPERISAIQLRLTDIDAHSAPARAAAILAGLGFDEAAQARPCSSFSGGWRMRVALASALFAAPDLLLLDEPSNYLDLEGTAWLEQFLKTCPSTCLIVSHDRDLLNKAVGAILHVAQGRVTLYAGGYDRFEEIRRERQRLDMKLRSQQDDERRRLEAFIDRFRAKATKARQAQSRVKALARMQPIAAQIDSQVHPFAFPNPLKPLGNPLLRLENVSAGYAPGAPVLSDLNLRLDDDDRIGLLGANGNGKSTFAKLLAGRLDPLTGHRRGSKKLKVGYFAQHQLDELNPARSPYEAIAERMADATEAQKRARLGALGFGIQTADTPAGQLSGGEKARLLFALAAFDGPHILLLDEPTNHLDVDAREALIHALNDYEGAVILISHDRHLIEATADRLWIVRDGTVRSYDGDLESYRAECLAERGRRRRAQRDETRGSGNGRTGRAEDRRQAAERRQALAPLKREMQARERQAQVLSDEIAAIDRTLADQGLYERDPARAQDLAAERGRLAKTLEAAETDWLAASEAYEEAMRQAVS